MGTPIPAAENTAAVYPLPPRSTAAPHSSQYKPTRADFVRAAVRQRMIDLMRKAGFYWEESSGRYKSKATGRYIKEATVNGLMAGRTGYARTGAAADIDNITQRFIDGGMTLDAWQRNMIAINKNVVITASVAGRGGKDQMRPSDWGRAGARVRWQAAQLDRLAANIAAGKYSAAQIAAYARQYAGISNTAFHDGLTAAKQAGGFMYEQRFLRKGETCVDCIGYAAQGKQAIGTLPEPGQNSVCGSNCNCEKRYFKS